MPLDPQLLPWLLVASLGLLWAVQSLRLWWIRRRPTRRLRAAARRGARGERAAERLLRARGFELLATQPVCRWRFQVDGKQHEVNLRADFLIRRGGLRYVADAKTGAATKLTAPTRRQLLEYRLAFDVDGVLLVDADAGRVREVVFTLR